MSDPVPNEGGPSEGPSEVSIASPEPTLTPAVGDKRKAEPGASDQPEFKKPTLPLSRNVSGLVPSDVVAAPPLPSFLKPPLLTVDTSLSLEELDEPVVPRTPANVRSMQRTELHAAVCAGNVAEATRLLEGGHHVDPQEEHGFTPLHNACALDKPPARASLVTLLLAHSADPCRGDNEGYTCLHWASACGGANVLQPLLDGGAQVAQKSSSGETALHRAARLGRVDCVKILAAAGGIEALTRPNHAFHSPLDVAGKVGVRVNVDLRAKARRAMLEAYPASRTLVLHHPDCQLHLTGDLHQEHPMRLEAILTLLQKARCPGAHAHTQCPHTCDGRCARVSL